MNDNKRKSGFETLEQYEREEPQDYQKQYMSPEDEKAFEEWARRLVPALRKEAF